MGSLFNNPLAITSATAVIANPDMARPEYLIPTFQPEFGTYVTRITGDYGAPIQIGGYWAKNARHHYSKTRPWNDDETLIYMKNQGGTPSQLILDGTTYAPLIGDEGTSNNSSLLKSSYDFRWRPGYPTQAVSWDNGAKKVVLWDVLTNTVVWRSPIIQHPSQSDGEHFGFLSEGDISTGDSTGVNRGRFIVLASSYDNPQGLGLTDQFCVVDLDNGVVGPWNNAPMPLGSDAAGKVDWVSISPSGAYVVCKYLDAKEYHRVFSVNQSTLVCTVVTLNENNHPLRMDSARTRTDGYLATLSHADMGRSYDPTLTPLSGATPQPYVYIDCLVGGLRRLDAADWCNDTEKKARGYVIAQGLVTGAHVHISRGNLTNGSYYETEDQHCSARCYYKEGFMLTGYSRDIRTPFRQYSTELVGYQILANGQMERFGRTHTNDNSISSSDPTAGGYYAEAHACPSPTFSRVMFASNWQYNALSPGDPREYKAYVITADPLVPGPIDDPFTHDAVIVPL